MENLKIVCIIIKAQKLIIAFLKCRCITKDLSKNSTTLHSWQSKYSIQYGRSGLLFRLLICLNPQNQRHSHGVVTVMATATDMGTDTATTMATDTHMTTIMATATATTTSANALSYIRIFWTVPKTSPAKRSLLLQSQMDHLLLFPNILSPGRKGHSLF